MFQDLKHRCMQEQTVLVKQLAGSYVLKTVEKLWLLQTFPKAHAQVESKIPKGKHRAVIEAAA